MDSSRSDSGANAMAAFAHQCECNLSYVDDRDRAVVEIGQGHLTEQFVAMVSERDALRAELEAAKMIAAEKGCQNDVLRAALTGLEQASTVTVPIGARTGPHWPKLTSANLKARAALKGGA